VFLELYPSLRAISMGLWQWWHKTILLCHFESDIYGVVAMVV
jgi:hypothetical protein